MSEKHYYPGSFAVGTTKMAILLCVSVRDMNSETSNI